MDDQPSRTSFGKIPSVISIRALAQFWLYFTGGCAQLGSLVKFATAADESPVGGSFYRNINMEKTFVMLGAGLMFLAVAAGAFGSHALGPYFEKHPDLSSIYETAVRYHMIHALALLAVAWAGSRWPVSLVNWSGWLFFAGILIFSGSLYALSLSGVRWLGAITPIGGVAFLSGWICLLLAAWRA